MVQSFSISVTPITMQSPNHFSHRSKRNNFIEGICLWNRIQERLTLPSNPIYRATSSHIEKPDTISNGESVLKVSHVFMLHRGSDSENFSFESWFQTFCAFIFHFHRKYENGRKPCYLMSTARCWVLKRSAQYLSNMAIKSAQNMWQNWWERWA